MSDEEFVSRIKTEVVWETFPRAGQVVERVPQHFESARFLFAKVELCETTTNGLTLAFRIGLSDAGDWSKIRFEGPLVTLRISRHLPIPREEIVGNEITLQYDEDGELLSATLLAIAVTHLRKPLDGNGLEARAVIENDEFFALFDETTSQAERERVLASATPIVFRPDKIDLLDEDSTETMFYRLLQVYRDFGVTIQTMDTGPGMVELESLDLPEPTQNPWVPVGDWSAWGPVPSVQRALNLE